MAPEQQKKFEKWLKPQIEISDDSIKTAYGEIILIGSDEHDEWVNEMRKEFIKSQPPRAGVIYVPWIIQERVEDIYGNDRSDAVAEWDKMHEACPKCNNTSLMTTMAGAVWHVGEPYEDNINTAHCAKCNWTGKVNQLKPKQDEI